MIIDINADGELLKFVGNKIKLLRKEKGLSQEKLAEKVGISRNAIGSIERGESNISILRLEAIFNALGFDFKKLFK